MSFFPTPEPIDWWPAIRYYGLLLGGLVLVAAVAKWQHWPELPEWGQGCLALAFLGAGLWPILRMGAKEPGK